MPEEKRKLGEILMEKGIIDRHQLKSALARQKSWGKKLGETLVDMGILTDVKLAEVLGAYFRVPVLNLRSFQIDRKALSFLKGEFCREHHVIPVALKSLKGKMKLVIAAADPSDLGVMDEVAFMSNHPVAITVAPLTEIKAAANKYYQESAAEIRDEITITQLKPDEEEVEVFRDGTQEKVSFGRSELSYPSLEMRFRSLVETLRKRGIISNDEADLIVNGLV